MGTKISEEALFHFRLIPAEQIRGGIVCFLFIMLIPALVTLSEPMMSIYFYIACAVWGAMLLWGVGLSLNPYQSEVGFVLYLGLYGLALGRYLSGRYIKNDVSHGWSGFHWIWSQLGSGHAAIARSILCPAF
ncbi:hypothetical protein PVOR_11549 [Paenibacillus vortex V453]|uniref:Uncharacterized protein n=1 Tax=Paenibacillus vortex V453 TaxID=715225 RepID=A0A2R9SXN6_9BACL|nr:hypothetical protein [Paenibacillus vortex]EFU42142.1 hypothetical protein PVOR_11549 [Paenibacillus vortex V453]